MNRILRNPKPNQRFPGRVAPKDRRAGGGNRGDCSEPRTVPLSLSGFRVYRVQGLGFGGLGVSGLGLSLSLSDFVPGTSHLPGSFATATGLRVYDRL